MHLRSKLNNRNLHWSNLFTRICDSNTPFCLTRALKKSYMLLNFSSFSYKSNTATTCSSNAITLHNLGARFRLK